MPHPIFQQTEFDSRLAQTRAVMSSRGLDLLILTDPCNIYYLCGYDGWSFYMPQVLLVPVAGSPVWVGRRMDAHGVRLTSCLAAEDVVGYPEHLIQNEVETPFGFIAQTIAERGWQAKRVGIEKQGYYFSVASFETLVEELPGSELIDASYLVNRVRFIKSPQEIGVMRQAARLLEAAMTAAVDVIRPGMRECDVVAKICEAQIGGVPDVGGVYCSTPSLVMSGARADTPHLPWTDERLAAQTTVNLELMGNRLRYQVPMGRTVVIGEPAPVMLRLESVALEVIDNILAFVKPGMICSDVSDETQRILRRHGIAKESRCGYSIGIAFPPTGGELTASLRAGDTTVLKPGAVIHFLPAIWADGGSIVISEPLLVTESGVECLANVPRRLFYC
ncbi:MAG: M24 family metallopeptidase [Steroidobacter sp.]|nr:M24 family metallopeptidase [Steroidobacter sp.]